jgi:DNA-3-methyladenine glycosylase I
VPVHNDRELFETLILEGAQAGLSWYTILKRQEDYRKVFCNFEPKKVAKLTDSQLEKILTNDKIIRNRLKVYSVRNNALVFLSIQQDFGSFNEYLWSFVGKKTIFHNPSTSKDIPFSIPESEALAKDLKRRGMSFVGKSIIYAYMQAVGLVNDHTKECFCR